VLVLELRVKVGIGIRVGVRIRDAYGTKRMGTKRLGYTKRNVEAARPCAETRRTRFFGHIPRNS